MLVIRVTSIVLTRVKQAAMQDRKNKIRKVVSGCLLVLSLVVPLYIECDRQFDDMCGVSNLRTLKSPDGKVKVVIFSQSCGATTSESEQVALLPADTKQTIKWGNVFIADSDHGAAPKGPEVEVVWESNERLHITYHPRARTFTEKQRVRVSLGFLQARTISVAYTKRGVTSAER